MVWVEVRRCRRVRSRYRIGFTGRIGGLCGFWSAWWPPPASLGIVSASTERSFRARQARLLVAAGAVRGAGDRRPLRHLRRPGEPRGAERAHDRAPRRRPACVLEAGPKGRGHVARRRAGRRRHRAGARQGWQSSALRHVSRLPARRPARHRGIEPAWRRRDPVRDADGDGRPGGGAGGARLPAARRDRQLLRRHRGAGLPEAPSLLGAHAHPHGRDRDRRPLLRPLRRQRPARPRPAREALRLRPRLPESVPGLGAPVRRAREGLERPPRERHDGRRARLRRPRSCCST